MEVNQNGFTLGEADFISGLDMEKLQKIPHKELVARFCKVNSFINGNQEDSFYDDKQKLIGIYEQEFFRRVIAGELHPDDFEKMCDEWYKENETCNEKKTGRLNSEYGYL